MAAVNAMAPNMARATTSLMEKKHLHTLEEGCMSVAASSHIRLSVRMRNQRMLARMAEEVERQDASPKDARAGIWVPSRGGEICWDIRFSNCTVATLGSDDSC